MSPNASLDSAKGPSDGLKESTRACFDDFKNVILAFGKADSQSPCDDDDDDVNAAETALLCSRFLSAWGQVVACLYLVTPDCFRPSMPTRC